VAEQPCLTACIPAAVCGLRTTQPVRTMKHPCGSCSSLLATLASYGLLHLHLHQPSHQPDHVGAQQPMETPQAPLSPAHPLLPSFPPHHPTCWLRGAACTWRPAHPPAPPAVSPAAAGGSCTGCQPLWRPPAGPLAGTQGLRGARRWRPAAGDEEMSSRHNIML
jgi:hypothetical protein